MQRNLAFYWYTQKRKFTLLTDISEVPCPHGSLHRGGEKGGRQNKQEVVGDLENNKLGKRYVV